MNKLYVLLPQGQQLVRQSFQIACSNLPRTASTATSAILMSIASACLFKESPYKQAHRVGFVFTASLLMGGARYYASKCAAAAFAATATAVVVSAIALVTFSLMSKLKKPLTNYLLRSLGFPTSNLEALKKLFESEFFKNLKVPQNEPEVSEIASGFLIKAGVEDAPKTVPPEDLPELLRQSLPEELKPFIDQLEEQINKPNQEDKNLEIIQIDAKAGDAQTNEQSAAAQNLEVVRELPEEQKSVINMIIENTRLKSTCLRLEQENESLRARFEELRKKAPILAAAAEGHEFNTDQFVIDIRKAAPKILENTGNNKIRTAVYCIVQKFMKELS